MGKELSIELIGARQLHLNVARKGEEAVRAVGASLYREGEAIMGDSKSLVPVDMGILRTSGRTQFPAYTDTSVSVTLSYGGAAGKYAVYVHEGIGPAVGRPPFMPPVAPFEEWARRHGMAGAGFLIARSVGMKGLKPTKYLERPFLAAANGMERRLANSVSRILGG